MKALVLLWMFGNGIRLGPDSNEPFDTTRPMPGCSKFNASFNSQLDETGSALVLRKHTRSHSICCTASANAPMSNFRSSVWIGLTANVRKTERPCLSDRSDEKPLKITAKS